MILHELTDWTPIAGAVVSVAWLIVKLRGKNEIGNAKAEIIEEVRGIGTKLQVHVAEDEGKHTAMDQHLKYTDSRIDRLERSVS